VVDVFPRINKDGIVTGLDAAAACDTLIQAVPAPGP